MRVEGEKRGQRRRELRAIEIDWDQESWDVIEAQGDAVRVDAGAFTANNGPRGGETLMFDEYNYEVMKPLVKIIATILTRKFLTAVELEDQIRDWFDTDAKRRALQRIDVEALNLDALNSRSEVLKRQFRNILAEMQRELGYN